MSVAYSRGMSKLLWPRGEGGFANHQMYCGFLEN